MALFKNNNGGFPTERASNAESISMSWRRNDVTSLYLHSTHDGHFLFDLGQHGDLHHHFDQMVCVQDQVTLKEEMMIIINKHKIYFPT